MTEPREYDLQVMIASGPEDLARAVLGFAYAVSAAAAGVKVLVVLTLNAVTWLTADDPMVETKVNGFDSIRDYLAALKETGAVVRRCSTCAMAGCAVAVGGTETREEESYIGLTEAALRTVRGPIQTLVF